MLVTFLRSCLHVDILIFIYKVGIFVQISDFGLAKTLRRTKDDGDDDEDDDDDEEDDMTNVIGDVEYSGSVISLLSFFPLTSVQCMPCML